MQYQLAFLLSYLARCSALGIRLNLIQLVGARINQWHFLARCGFLWYTAAASVNQSVAAVAVQLRLLMLLMLLIDGGCMILILTSIDHQILLLAHDLMLSLLNVGRSRRWCGCGTMYQLYSLLMLLLWHRCDRTTVRCLILIMIHHLQATINSRKWFYVRVAVIACSNGHM